MLSSVVWNSGFSKANFPIYEIILWFNEVSIDAEKGSGKNAGTLHRGHLILALPSVAFLKQPAQNVWKHELYVIQATPFPSFRMLSLFLGYNLIR